jgi:hypothetical protein
LNMPFSLQKRFLQLDLRKYNTKKAHRELYSRLNSKSTTPSEQWCIYTSFLRPAIVKYNLRSFAEFDFIQNPAY